MPARTPGRTRPTARRTGSGEIGGKEAPKANGAAEKDAIPHWLPVPVFSFFFSSFFIFFYFFIFNKK